MKFAGSWGRICLRRGLEFWRRFHCGNHGSSVGRGRLEEEWTIVFCSERAIGGPSHHQKLFASDELCCACAELGNDVPKEPLIFLKPPSSIVGPGEPIVLPKYSNKVEHEGELGLVVGRRAAHFRSPTTRCLISAATRA